MKKRDAKLAVLDTNIFAELSSPTAARMAYERLGRLRSRGYLTAVTPTSLMELAAQKNRGRIERLIDDLKQSVDIYLPFESVELARIELEQADPEDYIGNHVLKSTQGLPKFMGLVDDPAAAASIDADRRMRDGFRSVLPSLDPEIRKLAPDELPRTFADYAAQQELPQAVAFLEALRDSGRVGAVAVSTEAAGALLKRGRAIRMAITLMLANHYYRARAWVDEKRQTKPAGALSDSRILGEAAYADLFLTKDKECLACGKLINTVIALPQISKWDEV